MSLQFVDFNADGHVDIVTGTFDGSPHVAYGSADGFENPSQILDADGKRIMLSQFWDYEASKWKNTGEPHCISGVAFDWDDDGDHDLLIGDYHGAGGKIYRCMNEGTAAAPKFNPKPIEILAGGQPFSFDGGLTAPYLVDWDGDGLMDLVCGSFGEAWSTGGGGVWWFKNVGEKGAPRFAEGKVLLETGTPGTRPTRPDTGLYVAALDYDGDGDLDLLVGGYSLWTGEAVEGGKPAAGGSNKQRDSFVWLYRRVHQPGGQ